MILVIFGSIYIGIVVEDFSGFFVALLVGTIFSVLIVSMISLVVPYHAHMKIVDIKSLNKENDSIFVIGAGEYSYTMRDDRGKLLEIKKIEF